MANNLVSIMIYTASGTSVVLATTGSYDLRTSPFSSTGIVGTHSGGGIWLFTGLDDTAGYKLYNTGTGSEVTSFTGGGTNTRVFLDGDLQNYIRHNGTITFSANQPMGGFKLTGLGAGSTNGDSVRYEQAILTSGTQTKAGQLYFDTTSSIIPIVLQPSTTGYPTNQGHVATKYYVDTVVGGVVSPVQSTYLIKCLPSRTTEDIYSKQTIEKCNTYLSALSNISTYTGTILIEPLAQAGNIINLDDGTSQWISAGVYIEGVGSKPVLNRRAPNSSLTVAGGIINCHIVDNNVVSARSYTNFTFENCTFDIPDATDVTFTTCKFKGVNKIKSDGGGDLTLTNCTGDMVIYNDSITTVSITGTQPAQVISTDATNFDY